MIDCYAITHEEILVLILESIQVEDNIRDKLNQLTLDIEIGRLGHKEVGTAIAISVLNLATHIVNELQAIGAYVSGYLPYYYDPDMKLGEDLILTRLDAEDLEFYSC